MHAEGVRAQGVRVMRNVFAGALGVCVMTAIATVSCASTSTASNTATAGARVSQADVRAEPSTSAQVAIWSYTKFPWNQISADQRAQILRVRDKVAVTYRKHLRIGLLGPRHVLAVFVSRSPVPPDYGAESIALNDCHATPNCKYFCDGRYSDGEVAANGPSGSCDDGALFFYKDIRVAFPRGQMHASKEHPCVHVHGRSFGSCAKS